jgi:hypothetical protein
MLICLHINLYILINLENFDIINPIFLVMIVLVIPTLKSFDLMLLMGMTMNILLVKYV